MKLTLRNVGSAISILFCIGGAFNVGMSGIFLATPFMFFLCFINSVKFWSFFASLAFVVACAFINNNIYTNSFVFPILKNGVEMVVTHDSLFLKFPSESGTFVEPGSDMLNHVIKEKKEILTEFIKDDTSSFMEIPYGSYSSENLYLIKLKKDQKLKINGVYNFGGIDSENKNYIITEFGRVAEEEINKGNIRIIPDNPVQSKWSIYLGNLMYWPALPLALLSIFH